MGKGDTHTQRRKEKKGEEVRMQGWKGEKGKSKGKGGGEKKGVRKEKVEEQHRKGDGRVTETKRKKEGE
ncbi:hypothetical protein FV262_26830 [Escherichia coli]|nr:hypothetical protein FV262_26830 [Escherichia coli]